MKVPLADTGMAIPVTPCCVVPRTSTTAVPPGVNPVPAMWNMVLAFPLFGVMTIRGLTTTGIVVVDP